MHHVRAPYHAGRHAAAIGGSRVAEKGVRENSMNIIIIMKRVDIMNRVNRLHVTIKAAEVAPWQQYNVQWYLLLIVYTCAKSRDATGGEGGAVVGHCEPFAKSFDALGGGAHLGGRAGGREGGREGVREGRRGGVHNSTHNYYTLHTAHFADTYLRL